MANRTVEVIIDKIPRSVEEFKALPQASQTSEFDVAALTVIALCVYPENRDASLEMLNVLRGPRPLSEMDKQFIRDRFMDKDYVPRSFLRGAVPGNDYTVAAPYVIEVEENPYSYEQEGYAKLYLKSGGADSPRAVQLRLAKDGKWYLWEQFLLADIRQPESSNLWA